MSRVLHFDSLDYVEKAEKLGVPQELAKFQARKLEEAIEVAINQVEKTEFTTKKDLAELKLELIKWILGTGATSIIILCGAMVTMLKLMFHS